MKQLLDTNICIAFLHRKEQSVIEKLAQIKPHDMVLCSIVKAELLFGARRSQRVTDNLQILTRFFSNFQCVPFDDKAAGFYGTIRAHLVRGGTPIGTNDLLIASIALGHNLAVVTRNTSEFTRIPGLRVETW